jgi:hypothetical protein
MSFVPNSQRARAKDATGGKWARKINNKRLGRSGPCESSFGVLDIQAS